MGASTHLYLPLHVRTRDLLLVLAKVAGEPYTFRSFDKEEVVSYRPYKTKKVPAPFNPDEPASEENPWHIRFERDGQGLGVEPANNSSVEHLTVSFQDAAKNPFSWSYFPEYDQVDDDRLFLRRAKQLSPGSHPMAVAICKRLVKFFGGELAYNDCRDQDKPDVVVSQKQATFPLMPKGSTSNDQWYAFYNALKNEPLLTPAELQEAIAQASYSKLDDRQEAFLKAIRSYELSLKLNQSLEQPEPSPKGKPRF